MKYYYVYYMKLAVLVVLLITIPTAFNSCKKAAEKSSEEIIEKSIGDDAEVDIDKDKVVIKTEEGTFITDVSAKSWPEEIPEDVPEFKDGKVASTSSQQMDEGKHWAVILEDVSEKALSNYQKNLEQKGFKIKYVTIAERGGHLAAEKGQLTVTVMSGDGNATITIGIKN